MLAIPSLRSVPSFASSHSSNDNVDLIDNLGPFSSFQGRLASTSSFYTSPPQAGLLWHHGTTLHLIHSLPCPTD